MTQVIRILPTLPAYSAPPSLYDEGYMASHGQLMAPPGLGGRRYTQGQDTTRHHHHQKSRSTGMNHSRRLSIHIPPAPTKPRPLPPAPRSGPPAPPSLPALPHIPPSGLRNNTKTRHTRQRAHSISGRTLQQAFSPRKPFDPFAEDDEDPILITPLKSSSMYNISSSLVMDDNRLTPTVTIPSPDKSEFPKTPLHAPIGTKKGSTSLANSVVEPIPITFPVTSTPPSKPQQAQQPRNKAPTVPACELRSRLLASILLSKFQGGRSRRSMRKPRYVPSGLSSGVVYSAEDL